MGSIRQTGLVVFLYLTLVLHNDPEAVVLESSVKPSLGKPAHPGLV